MVKKAKWLKNVKKAFSADSKKLKHESGESEISYPVLIATSRNSHPQFEVRVDEVNYEKNKNLCPPLDSVTTIDEDGLVDSPPSSPESVPQDVVDNRFVGKSKEEAASILIQTMFRGYLARRESQTMRGKDRLKLLMDGLVVQRQAANTLKCMQTLTRVQSQIRSRRIRMSEENQAQHKQLLQKHAKELGGLKNGGNWNGSYRSKEQVEAGMLRKCEATMRRERALAYAFTHQQNLKSISKTANPMFMDPSNPTWGWSWLERWMAGQHLESSEKEQRHNNKNSLVNISPSHGGETAKKSSNRNKNNSSVKSNIPSSSSSSTVTKNPRKKKPIPSSTKSKSSDEEGKSSERIRNKHIITRSSVSDDESLASSTAKRSSNMVPRGKLRAQSTAPSRVTLTKTTTEENQVLPEKTPAKKRISKSASPAPKPRRSSAPPKIENGGPKAEKTP